MAKQNRIKVSYEKMAWSDVSEGDYLLSVVSLDYVTAGLTYQVVACIGTYYLITDDDGSDYWVTASDVFVPVDVCKAKVKRHE